MKQHFLSIFIFFGCFLIGVASIFGVRALQVKYRREPAFVPQPVSFTFSTPSKVVPAQVINVIGEVKKISTSSALLVDDQILPGEKIVASSDSSAEFQVDAFFHIIMQSLSGLGFNNGIPASYLVSQDSGNIEYSVTGDQSLSIRALNTLVRLSSGSAHLAIDASQRNFSLKISSGSAKMAWTNNQNETQVSDILDGQTAKFNNVSKKILVR